MPIDISITLPAANPATASARSSIAPGVVLRRRQRRGIERHQPVAQAPRSRPTKRVGVRGGAAPDQMQPPRRHVDAARQQRRLARQARTRSARRRRRIAAHRPPASVRWCHRRCVDDMRASGRSAPPVPAAARAAPDRARAARSSGQAPAPGSCQTPPRIPGSRTAAPPARAGRNARSAVRGSIVRPCDRLAGESAGATRPASPNSPATLTARSIRRVAAIVCPSPMPSASGPTAPASAASRRPRKVRPPIFMERQRASRLPAPSGRSAGASIAAPRSGAPSDRSATAPRCPPRPPAPRLSSQAPPRAPPSPAPRRSRCTDRSRRRPAMPGKLCSAA